MFKKILSIALIIIIVVITLTACVSSRPDKVPSNNGAISPNNQDEQSNIVPANYQEGHSIVPSNFGINPDDLPEVLTERTFPKYDLGSIQAIFGLAGKDVSGKDLSRLSLQYISNIAFDADTKWPDARKLPKGFSPVKWLQSGKDPGLNLSELHKKGYTGKGVSVAVIDKPIVATHYELEGHTEYIRVGTDYRTHFHGLSCATILAGKTCGVAPEAKLYYFAVPDDRQNFHNYCLAIDKLLELNKSLPIKNRIRLFSISDGIIPGDEYWDEWSKSLQKAENEGIIVLYSLNVGKNFLWGGCPPYKDRNDPRNYSINNYLKGYEKAKPLIILPADYRTTATNQGDHQYAYWGEGGFSWAIPYLAGLCTLALQIYPDLKYEDMLNAFTSTKVTTPEGYSVVNPSGFIKAIESRK